MRKPRAGRRERQLSGVLQFAADLHYCYKLERDGTLTAEWRSGRIAGVAGLLPQRAPAEGCWAALAHPADAAGLCRRHDRLLRGRPSVDDFRIILPGGRVRWIRVFSQPEWDEDRRRTTHIVGAVQDISEHKQTEHALRDSEQRFKDILESSTDWIWETDADHRFSFFSQRLTELTGIDTARWLARRCDEILTEVAPPGSLEGHRADLAAHRPLRNFTFWVDAPSGPRCFSISGKPVSDESAGFRGYRGTGTDITERKQAEEHQRLLLAELDHRMKNTLAVVGSLLRQTRRSSRSPEEFEVAFTGRIYAMARAHGLLTQNRWAGSGLRELVRQILAPYREQGGRVEIAGAPEVRLTPQTAVTLSMALHELATNAVKYGALSVADGRVRVCWRVAPAAEQPRLIVAWREVGGPTVGAPAHHGFGSTLIERSVAYELEGRVALDFAPEGVHCEMEIPLTKDIGSLGPV